MSHACSLVMPATPNLQQWFSILQLAENIQTEFAISSIHAFTPFNSSLDKLVNRQPVNIDRPIRPPRALPVLLIVQISRDINVFPDRVKTRFMQIDLRNLQHVNINNVSTLSSSVNHTFV
jgi:hypothetical protein